MNKYQSKKKKNEASKVTEPQIKTQQHRGWTNLTLQFHHPPWSQRCVIIWSGERLRGVLVHAVGRPAMQLSRLRDNLTRGGWMYLYQRLHSMFPPRPWYNIYFPHIVKGPHW